jgi:hypothetical protein
MLYVHDTRATRYGFRSVLAASNSNDKCNRLCTGFLLSFFFVLYMQHRDVGVWRGLKGLVICIRGRMRDDID